MATRYRRYRYGEFTPRRRQALRKAQLVSARKRRLAIAGVGVGVLAVGTTAIVLGRKHHGLGGSPKQVINHAPPQASPANVVHEVPKANPIPPRLRTLAARGIQLDEVKQHPKMGDVVEVTIPNAITGTGHRRMYGLYHSKQPTRHSSKYKVTVRAAGHAGILHDTVPEWYVTGVKTKGAANFHASVKELMAERKKRGG